MSVLRLACLLFAVLLAAGCGGGGGGGGDGDLEVVRVDGTAVDFREGWDVFCGPWDDDVAVPALHVESPPRAMLREDSPPAARFLVAAVLRDLASSRTITFPHSFVFSRPTKALVFVYDGERKNETASDQEESRGRLVVRSYSCERKEADLEFEEVVLGSEFSDGEAVTVRGSLRVGG